MNLKEKKLNNELKIRPLCWSDIDLLCAFVNRLSKENTYVMLSGETITREQEVEYVSQSLVLTEKNKKIHLVVTYENEIVGNAEVRIQEKRKNHSGIVTIAIDKKMRGKGVGTALLKTLIDNARRMKLKMLYLSSMYINSAGIAVYEKLGFKQFGLLPGAFFYKGTYVDEVFYYLKIN